MTRSEKKVVRSFIAQAWPLVNLYNQGHGRWKPVNFRTDLATIKRYFAWCRRHSLNPVDREHFRAYWGFRTLRDYDREYAEKHGIVPTQHSLAEVEYYFGSGAKGSRLGSKSEGIKDFLWVTIGAHYQDSRGTHYQDGQRETGSFDFLKQRCKVSPVKLEGITRLHEKYSLFDQTKWTYSCPLRGGYSCKTRISISVTPIDNKASVPSTVQDLVLAQISGGLSYEDQKTIKLTLQKKTYRSGKRILKENLKKHDRRIAKFREACK